jgi:RNA polymerase sigma factor (sigma-70 family)
VVGFRGALSDEERTDLQRVYRLHVSSVYAFFAYSVDATTAEDLTAATFERVVRSWRRYDASRGRIETWLLAIARNILRDHLRRQSHRAGPSLDEFPALAQSFISRDGSPGDRLDAIALHEWLSQLQPREREVLGLRYGADLTSAEIGRCLGLTQDNVNQIASRALRRLRAIATAAPPVNVSNRNGNAKVNVGGRSGALRAARAHSGT